VDLPDETPAATAHSQPLAAGLGPGARRLLRLAVAALARREHSRQEIEIKLRRKLAADERAREVAPEAAPDAAQDAAQDSDAAQGTVEDIEPVLDRLQSRGLLSDQRMAQALVRTRGARYGRLRLHQELERRGVDRETIAATLPPAQDEFAVALALWQRKFGRAPATPQERARQGRFLAARGFAADTIARILSNRSPD
jgi:regulatory protein